MLVKLGPGDRRCFGTRPVSDKEKAAEELTSASWLRGLVHVAMLVNDCLDVDGSQSWCFSLAWSKSERFSSGEGSSIRTEMRPSLARPVMAATWSRRRGQH